MKTLEQQLLFRMLKSDFEIAERMAEIGDFAMAHNALDNAKTKLTQLAAISDTDRGTSRPAALPIEV